MQWQSAIYPCCPLIMIKQRWLKKKSRENKPLCGEPTSKKLGLLFGTSPLAFKGLPVIAIDFGRALLRISPSMSISRDDSPPEKLQNKCRDPLLSNIRKCLFI